MARTAMSNNGMDETFPSGGFDVGFYPSFPEIEKKNFNFYSEDSYGFDEEHACHGLFTELGFSEEIPAPKWSLTEQFGMIPCTDNPCLEEIIDEACSPLSVDSMDSAQNSFLDNPSLQDIVDEACSSLSPVSSDTSITSESCVASPYSDSGVSCSPSCSPACSPSGIEVLDSSLWEEVETIDWSSFTFPPDNGTQTEVKSNIEVQECSTSQSELNVPSIDKMDVDEGSPTIPKIDIPLVEKVAGSVDNVIDIEQIVPSPTSELGKVVVLKAVSVRAAPYRKPGKEKKRRKTKEQKERKKNQNRDAALRYRSKKKEELQDLFDEAAKLEDSNKDLTDKVTGLQKEIDYLKNLMLDVIKARLSKMQNKDENVI